MSVIVPVCVSVGVAGVLLLLWTDGGLLLSESVVGIGCRNGWMNESAE